MKQNSKPVLHGLRRLTPLIILLILLPACSSHSARSDQAGTDKGRIITVTSSPPGAIVRANGNKLGETPLKVDIDKSFPRKWVFAEDYGIVYRVSGKLTLEKSGCDDYTVLVTHAEPADDVDVTLVCTEEASAPGPLEPVKPVIPETVEQRLRKLDKLHRDGVITGEEYRQQRKRILDEI